METEPEKESRLTGDNDRPYSLGIKTRKKSIGGGGACQLTISHNQGRVNVLRHAQGKNYYKTSAENTLHDASRKNKKKQQQQRRNI